MGEKYTAGFHKGWNQLRLKDVEPAKKELMQALGINNKMSWNKYRNGQIEPRASQAANVEAIFKKYGITNIWGK